MTTGAARLKARLDKDCVNVSRITRQMRANIAEVERVTGRKIQTERTIHEGCWVYWMRETPSDTKDRGFAKALVSIRTRADKYVDRESSRVASEIAREIPMAPTQKALLRAHLSVAMRQVVRFAAKNPRCVEEP